MNLPLAINVCVMELYIQSCGYVAYMSAGVGGLEGPLKNLNPDKLMR